MNKKNSKTIRSEKISNEKNLTDQTQIKKGKLTKKKAVISIVMGSNSDYSTMKNVEEMLDNFSITYETKIISAHRTPQRLYAFCEEVKNRGVQIIIAGAGGAAHLPGMIASMTDLPVLGVPVESKALKGLDSLLSIAQMPAGIPVSTFAIGEAGAKNSALFAVAILSLSDKKIAKKLSEFRKKQTDSVKQNPTK